METLKKTRVGASVNAYLILRKGKHVLLHLRKNTGYYDDCYGLVSGHVEDGESATAGMIREAFEEAGITLTPHSLQLVHILHRQTNRFNIDLFFECHQWQGEIVNRESEKCAELTFFPLTELPSNTIDYIQEVLQAIQKGKLYSECGW